jgi:glutaredoxin 3
MAKKVKVYTTPTCPWCKKTKEFLKEKKIPYTEYDVSSDEKARNQMIELSGQMGVPVVEIGDSVIVGFNPDEILKSVGSKKKK